MRLFWGMFDDFLVPHQHAFDPNKWKSKGKWETTPVENRKAVLGEAEYYQNTCLSCGDIVERKFLRGNEDKG